MQTPLPRIKSRGRNRYASLLIRQLIMSTQSSDAWQWTEAETRLLLQATLDFKASEALAGAEWEANRKKYAAICAALLADYPEDDAQNFPHRDKISTKSVAAKLKAVRAKYRDAVNSGKKSGHGRVVYLFYELCSDIWSGTPGVTRLPNAVCTASLLRAAQQERADASSMALSSIRAEDDGAQPGTSITSYSPSQQRRDKLQVSSLWRIKKYNSPDSTFYCR